MVRVIVGEVLSPLCRATFPPGRDPQRGGVRPRKQVQGRYRILAGAGLSWGQGSGREGPAPSYPERLSPQAGCFREGVRIPNKVTVWDKVRVGTVVSPPIYNGIEAPRSVQVHTAARISFRHEPNPTLPVYPQCDGSPTCRHGACGTLVACGEISTQPKPSTVQEAPRCGQVPPRPTTPFPSAGGPAPQGGDEWGPASTPRARTLPLPGPPRPPPTCGPSLAAQRPPRGVKGGEGGGTAAVAGPPPHQSAPDRALGRARPPPLARAASGAGRG